MHGRWFNSGVVLLWLATMSWLVKEKVLPPLLVGEPPNLSKIVKAQELDPPVGWRILCNDRRFGWALSDAKLQPNDLTDIRGRVHIRALKLTETMSGGLRALCKLLGQSIDQLQMDAWSVVTVDPLGGLVEFNSTVQLEPSRDVLSVSGTVEGSQLHLQFRAGGASVRTETFLPAHALLSDALSPQTQLPGLRAGQSWSVPVYSPLLPTSGPLEIIYATVEEIEPILWNGETYDTWVVVYRSEPKSETGAHQTPRGKLWVRRDGTVLKQQVLFFDTLISFIRLSDDETIRLTARTGPEWWKLDRQDWMRHHD
jgi:hypothetical protein